MPKGIAASAYVRHRIYATIRERIILPSRDSQTVLFQIFSKIIDVLDFIVAKRLRVSKYQSLRLPFAVCDKYICLERNIIQGSLSKELCLGLITRFTWAGSRWCTPRYNR
jgi:hypothetical protein